MAADKRQGKYETGHRRQIADNCGMTFSKGDTAQAVRNQARKGSFLEIQRVSIRVGQDR
jgi:hypothetical protein